MSLNKENTDFLKLCSETIEYGFNGVTRRICDYEPIESKLLELQTQIETLQSQLKQEREGRIDAISKERKRWAREDLDAINKMKKQAEIDAIEKMAESLITGAVANHWCEKEQAGYFWCHNGITNYLNKLKEQD